MLNLEGGSRLKVSSERVESKGVVRRENSWQQRRANISITAGCRKNLLMLGAYGGGLALPVIQEKQMRSASGQ